MLLKRLLTIWTGPIGVVIFYLISLGMIAMPCMMLSLPVWAIFLVVVACKYIPFAYQVLWIAGLFGAIAGKQDSFAVVYYVIFALTILNTIVEIMDIVSCGGYKNKMELTNRMISNGGDRFRL